MNEFDRRINNIYPSNLISFIVITLLAVVAIILLINPESIINYGTAITFLVWLYVAIFSIDILVIRYHIYKKAKTNKKDLIAFLEHRIVAENRKVKLLKNKHDKTIQNALKEVILDLKKDKLKVQAK